MERRGRIASYSRIEFMSLMHFTRAHFDVHVIQSQSKNITINSSCIFVLFQQNVRVNDFHEIILMHGLRNFIVSDRDIFIMRCIVFDGLIFHNIANAGTQNSKSRSNIIPSELLPQYSFNSSVETKGICRNITKSKRKKNQQTTISIESILC